MGFVQVVNKRSAFNGLFLVTWTISTAPMIKNVMAARFVQGKDRR